MIKLEGKKVLILGAGISGCSLAWILKRLGAEVTLVEREKDCGGIGRTFTLDGCRYEMGPHILHAVKDHTIQLYKNYGVRSLAYYAKMSVDDTIHQLVDFPYSVDTVFQLPRDLGRNVVQELYESGRNPVDSTNLETYLRSVVGPTLYNKFNAGYSEKFWGRDPKDVPANGAAGWINFRTSDKRLFMEWQGYPKVDFNGFMDWVRGDVPVIRANVEGINKKNSQITGIQTDQGELNADFYFSTIPLISCFPEMLNDLNYIGSTLVALRLKEGPVFPEGIGGVYFPNKFKFKRICEYPSITDENYPHLPKGTLLGVEYNVFPEKGVAIDEEYYLSDAIKACKELFHQEPVSTRFHYYRDVYPLRNPEQMQKFNKIQEQVTEYKNFFLSGRFGNFRYVNMNDCIEISFDLICKLTGKKLNTLIKEVGL